MMEEHQIRVQIADKHGGSTYMLNPSETLEMIHDSDTAWIYTDNQLVERDQLDELDEATLSTISTVRILPALVGGSTYSPHRGEEE